MFELLPFGAGAWTVIFLYIGSLLLFGWYGYRSRTENTLNDFYLAGPGFGFLVLLLTLYATQYSGNVFFAFTGMTYRIGFSWIMSTYFMLAIVVFYLVYALRLRTLSKRHGFITPVDYLSHRFRSNTLNLLAALVMIVSLSNFLLAQLMAMGRALQGMAGGYPDIAYTSGVIVLALIMVVYGTLGGLRAVAWTDVVQGTVLFIGFLLLMASLLIMFGPLSVATNSILNSPDVDKVILPDANRMREWLSYTLIDRKFDLLVQLAPAFMLGIRWGKLRAGPVVIGLVAGLAVSLALAFGPFEFVRAGKIWGFHPGLYGLLINLVIATGGSLLLYGSEHRGSA